MPACFEQMVLAWHSDIARGLPYFFTYFAIAMVLCGMVWYGIVWYCMVFLCNKSASPSWQCRVAISITKHLKIRRLHILLGLGIETYTRCQSWPSGKW